MSEIKTSIIQLPTSVPEVGKEKKYFAEASIDIGEMAQAVDDAEYAIQADKLTKNPDPEVTQNYNAARSVAYAQFHSGAKGLMRNLKPHLEKTDTAKYDEYWKKLQKRLDPEIHELEFVESLCSFLQEALKRANLSELGNQSRLEEIENEIDISRI